MDQENPQNKKEKKHEKDPVSVSAVLMLAACMSAFASCGESGEKKMKVGFIFLHDENSTYDNNFLAPPRLPARRRASRWS